LQLPAASRPSTLLGTALSVVEEPRAASREPRAANREPRTANRE